MLHWNIQSLLKYLSNVSLRWTFSIWPIAIVKPDKCTLSSESYNKYIHHPGMHLNYRVSKKGYPTLIVIKVLIIIRSPPKFHTVSGTLLALICALIHVANCDKIKCKNYEFWKSTWINGTKHVTSLTHHVTAARHSSLLFSLLPNRGF